MKKVALITGITGQMDLIYRILLQKNYEVQGLIRRSSTFNTQRIDHLIHDSNLKNTFFSIMVT